VTGAVDVTARCEHRAGLDRKGIVEVMDRMHGGLDGQHRKETGEGERDGVAPASTRSDDADDGEHEQGQHERNDADAMGVKLGGVTVHAMVDP
jgi:hypothetical protein